MKFLICVIVKDFDNVPVTNQFFVRGVEASWQMFYEMCERFCDAEVELVDYETGEIIKVYHPDETYFM